MGKVVKIPSHMIPRYVCQVNGREYSFPAGTEQEVPDDVATVIENFWDMQEEPDGIPYQIDEASIPDTIARDEEVQEMISTAQKTEDWVFTLENGTEVTKRVVLG